MAIAGAPLILAIHQSTPQLLVALELLQEMICGVSVKHSTAVIFVRPITVFSAERFHYHRVSDAWHHANSAGIV